MSDSSKDQLERLCQDHKVQLVVTQQDTDDEIDLGQLVRKVLDGKKTILLWTLLALLVTIVGFGGYSFIMQDQVGTVSTVLSFKFDGIEEGLNPNGEDFSIGEITNKKVLEDTIIQLGLSAKGIDSEVLRKNMVIQGIVPEDVIKRISLINQMAEKDVSQLEKLSDMTYHPTQYKIDLHILKNMNLNGEEAEQVLMALVNNYKEYFMNKYNDRKILSTAITTVDLDRYDYSEYVMLVDGQLDLAQVYLEDKQKEAPDFRSKTTGVGFGDLVSQVELTQNVEINNVQAIIDTFIVSKNKERLFSIYSNKVETMTLEMNQFKQQGTALRQAAKDYKKDSMVVLGNDGLESAMELTQNSEAYDQFITDAVAAEEKANTLKYDIQLYQELLARLTEANEAETVVDITPYVGQVETDIIYIADSVKELFENINATVDEYYAREVFKGSVKMDIPAIYSSNSMAVIKKFIMAVAISAVLGMMIGVMLALSKGMLQEDSSRRSK